jgi:hypothetical protein
MSSDVERLRDLLRTMEALVLDLRNQLAEKRRTDNETPCTPLGAGEKSHFRLVVEVLMERGNKPLPASTIVRRAGISRGALSQVLHRTHKDSFISIPIPGYSRKRLWKLTNEAEAAAQLGSLEQRTLFEGEGEFAGVKAVDCCFRILADRGNEPANALALAREAIQRGYRGRARGLAEEVQLTTAKSFWAALTRDDRFVEVRPLVFKLRQWPLPP